MKHKKLIYLSLCSLALLSVCATNIPKAQAAYDNSQNEINDNQDPDPALNNKTDNTNKKDNSRSDTKNQIKTDEPHETEQKDENHEIENLSDVIVKFRIREQGQTNYIDANAVHHPASIGANITLDKFTLPDGIRLVNDNDFPRQVTVSDKTQTFNADCERMYSTAKTNDDKSVTVKYVDVETNQTVGTKSYTGKQGTYAIMKYDLPKGYYFVMPDEPKDFGPNFYLQDSEYKFATKNPDVIVPVTKNGLTDGDMTATIHYLDSKTNKELKTQTIKGSKNQTVSIPWEYPTVDLLAENHKWSNGHESYTSKDDFIKNPNDGDLELDYTFRNDKQNIYVYVKGKDVDVEMKRITQDGKPINQNPDSKPKVSTDNKKQGQLIIPQKSPEKSETKKEPAKTVENPKVTQGENKSHDEKPVSKETPNVKDPDTETAQEEPIAKKNAKTKHNKVASPKKANRSEKTGNDNTSSPSSSTESPSIENDKSSDDVTPTKNEHDKTLPQTNDKSSSLGILGVLSVGLSALGLKRFNKKH